MRFCIAALISVSFNIVREKEELVNPSVETTQYKITQIKTNLETNEQTYVLTSDSDDSDVVKSYHSPSSC